MTFAEKRAEASAKAEPVLRAIAEDTRTTLGELRGMGKARVLTRARRRACHALTALGMTPAEIGRQLGGLHYKSVVRYLQAAP